MGTVEGKATRLELGKAQITYRASVFLRIETILTLYSVDNHHAIAELEGHLYRIAQASAVRVSARPLLGRVAAQHQAIYNCLDGVHLVAIEVNLFIHIVDFAVDSSPHVSGLAQIFEHTFVLPFAIANERGQDQDPAAVRHAKDARRRSPVRSGD